MKHATQYNNRILSLLMLTVMAAAVHAAGTLTVQTLENSHEANALQWPRITPDGLAAVVKIVAPATVSEVRGDLVVDDSQQPLFRRDTETWVWLKPGSRQLTVVLQDGRTVDVAFASYGISQLAPRTTYYLIVTDKDTTQGGTGSIRLSNTFKATIWLDGKELGPIYKELGYLRKQSIEYGDIPSGCHTLTLREKGRSTTTWRILVKSNAPTYLSFKGFQDTGASIRLRLQPIAQDLVSNVNKTLPLTTSHCRLTEFGFTETKVGSSEVDCLLFGGEMTDFDAMTRNIPEGTDIGPVVKPILKEDLRPVVLPIRKDCINLYRAVVISGSKAKAFVKDKESGISYTIDYETDEILKALEQCMKLP